MVYSWSGVLYRCEAILQFHICHLSAQFVCLTITSYHVAINQHPLPVFSVVINHGNRRMEGLQRTAKTPLIGGGNLAQQPRRLYLSVSPALDPHPLCRSCFKFAFWGTHNNIHQGIPVYAQPSTTVEVYHDNLQVLKHSATRRPTLYWLLTMLRAQRPCSGAIGPLRASYTTLCTSGTHFRVF